MHKLGLVSLANKRVDANLIFLRKLNNGCIDANTLLSRVNFKVPFRQTRPFTPFVITSHISNYGKNQPIDRMMRLGNDPHLFNRY